RCVVIAVSLLRVSLLGVVVSLLGFTLLFIIFLVFFAMIYQSFTLEGAGFFHSWKIVATAVVLHALIGLGKKLTPDKTRLAIAVVTASIMLIYPSAWMQILIILCAGMLGIILIKHKAESNLKHLCANITIQ